MSCISSFFDLFDVLVFLHEILERDYAVFSMMLNDILFYMVNMFHVKLFLRLFVKLFFE
jgi:hypothetical protein